MIAKVIKEKTGSAQYTDSGTDNTNFG